MRIELIRHGETAYQAEGRYQGRSDVPLSEAGRRALAPAGRAAETVCVTPLRRAVETAAILFPQAAQIAVDALREMDFGVFEGRNYQEMAEDPAYRAWVDGGCLGPCPGGESKDAFCGRVCPAFAALVDEALGRGAAELVIVAHGGTQMAVMEGFAEPRRPYFDWRLKSGQGYVLDTSPWAARHRLRLVGQTDYTRDG